MKKIIIIFQFLMVLNIFSTELNNYDLLLINSIVQGHKEGQIGWERAFAGTKPEPITFAISNLNEIYVPDFVNYRINVYDSNLLFRRTIIEDKNKYMAGCKKMCIDNQGNIIGVINTFGIKKMDSKGKEIYSILRENLPKAVYNYMDFFLINNLIFFYNDHKTIQFIDENGVIQEIKKAYALLEKLSSSSQTNQEVQGGGGKNSGENIFDELRKDKEHILINDQYFSTQFYKHKKYYKQIQSTKPTPHPAPKAQKQPIAPSKSLYSPPAASKKLNIDLEDYSLGFIGYDNDHNSYWRAGKKLDGGKVILAIIILNKYGEVLDAFKTGERLDGVDNTALYPASNSIKAVSPNGDIFFMVGSKEKYSFYKVKRQW